MHKKIVLSADRTFFMQESKSISKTLYNLGITKNGSALYEVRNGFEDDVDKFINKLANSKISEATDIMNKSYKQYDYSKIIFKQGFVKIYLKSDSVIDPVEVRKMFVDISNRINYPVG